MILTFMVRTCIQPLLVHIMLFTNYTQEVFIEYVLYDRSQPGDGPRPLPTLVLGSRLFHSLAANLFVKLSWEELSGPQADFRPEEAQPGVSAPRVLAACSPPRGWWRDWPWAAWHQGFLHSFSKCALRSPVSQALIQGRGESDEQQ